MAAKKKADEPEKPSTVAHLDPELARLRDEEAKRLEAVQVTPREEPTLDPLLEQERKRELEGLNPDGTRKVTDYHI